MHFIVNPTAGGGRGGRAAPGLRRWARDAGVDASIAETQARGHARDLAYDAVRAGAPGIVAVGGDGTVHEVANGILAAAGEGAAPAPPLGVLPVGSGNDFATLVGGTRDAGRLYHALERGDVRSFDAGRVIWDGGEEYFINAMGLGIDVEVVRQVERLPRLPGAVGYLLGLFRALLRYRPIAVRVSADGETRAGRIMMVAVGNGDSLGGGFHVCPHARPDDGRFDVCMIRSLGPVAIARTIPRVLRGSHEGMPGVTMMTGTEVEILLASDGGPLFFELDGELREPPTARGLRVTLLPAALRVLVPAEADA